MRLIEIGDGIWLDPTIVVSVVPYQGDARHALVTTATPSKEQEYVSLCPDEQVIEALRENAPYGEN